MSPKIRSAIAGLLLLTLLAACSPSGADRLVGRWEFGDRDFGAAYEFYEDGTFAHFSSIDPLHPMMNLGTYTYEPDGGILRLDLLDDRFGAIISLVSFESDDVIRIEENQIKTAFEYARQPLPELPPGARARLGNLVLGRAYTLGGVEKLEPGWQENYGDYRIVAVTDIEMVVGETLEEWLVSLRIEGEAEDGLYVLSKGQGSWGIWQLVR